MKADVGLNQADATGRTQVVGGVANGRPIVLSTVSLSKHYGGIVANDNVTLTLSDGEIRGLIGPNGAGKTTLINLVSGLQRPSSGDVLLDGRSLAGMPPHRRARLGLARTFQVPSLFGRMSVFENLVLPDVVLGTTNSRDRRSRADDLLALTGLGGLRDEPAKRLSGGQQALLQLASGFMAPNLRCYLLDEPFAGVNPVLREKMIELVQHFNTERGTSFILVSHEMTVIRQLCPTVSVMIDGRIRIEGTLDEVVRHDDVIDAYLGRAL